MAWLLYIIPVAGLILAGVLFTQVIVPQIVNALP